MIIPFATLIFGLLIGFLIAKFWSPFKPSFIGPTEKESETAFEEVKRFDSLMQQIPGKPVKRYRAVTYSVDSLHALLNKYPLLKREIIAGSGYTTLGDTSKYSWEIGFYPGITEDTLFTINIIPTVAKARKLQDVHLPYTDNQDYFDFITHFEGASPGHYQFPNLYKKGKSYVYDYGTLIP